MGIKGLVTGIALSIVMMVGMAEGAVANQSWVIEDVKACPYNTSEYVVDIFDCSNMAHMLYDWLTEHGHNCYVVCGKNETIGISHCWLLVDGYVIEPTTKDWAWWLYNRWFEMDKTIYIDPYWMYGKEWDYPRRW